MLNKIKNNTFLKSTLILLFGGFFGKLIGFIIRIVITRTLSTSAIGLISMLSATTSLLTVISIFSYSNAVSKYIADSSSRASTLFTSLIPVSVFINLLIIIIIIFFGRILSDNLLKDSDLYYPIICISLTMPFISVSAIIKGYFWGKENMSPYMLSNFIEQLVRLFLIFMFLKKIAVYSEIYAICFITLINILGELSSQVVMLKYINKPKKIEFKIDFNEIKKIYSYCIPATFSKILSSIAYFLEPIIITNVLLFVGYSKDYIIYEYGIINAYSLALLLLPLFFTQNMSTSLIPELSKNYELNNIELCKKRIKQIVLFSSFIGVLCTIIIFIFPSFLLKLLYNTNKGVDYIRLLCPFSVLFYIETPLNNALSALGKTKEIFNITLKVSIIRIISIIFFSFLKIGMYSLVITIIINLIVSTLFYYYSIKKALYIR